MRTPFTADECITMQARLKKYGPAVDPATVDFYWVEFWFERTCGYFKPKRSIYLNIKDRLAIVDGNADDIICHELYHCMQYRKLGWLRYSLRNLTKISEIEAYAEQERVRVLMEGLG
jgi:hypothetical protein